MGVALRRGAVRRGAAHGRSGVRLEEPPVLLGVRSHLVRVRVS